MFSPLQYSCLENPMDRGAWWATVHGITNSQMRLNDQDTENTQLYIQFSSVAQSYLTLCDPMDHSMPGLPVHHQLLESSQTHVH